MGSKGTYRKNLVGVSFDDNYVYPFFILAYSLKKNALNNFKIFIANVNKSISIDNVNLIHEFTNYFEIEIEFVEFECDFSVQTDQKISIAAYGRFYLMETMQSDFLYIDVDSIAYYGWDQFLVNSIQNRNQKFAVQATTELKSLHFASQARFQSNKARQNARETYLFSGLLIVNVKKLEEINFSTTWRISALQYEQLGFMQHDQDVLNYVLANFVEPLPVFANHLHGTPMDYPVFFSSCIGHPKPWTISSEEQVKLSGLSAMGFKDLGKTIWVLDFYDYWSHEKALYVDLDRLDSKNTLSIKLLRLREKSEKLFLNNRARLKWKVLESTYRALSFWK